MAMHQMLNVPDEPRKLLDGFLNPPVDVKEYPGCYIFLADMPGLIDTDIKGVLKALKSSTYTCFPSVFFPSLFGRMIGFC